MARSLADLGRVRDLAAQAGRTDLVARLAEAQARLHSTEVRVAVVGEFKQGKSTLINALLRTDVCPVDADIVTAVPTVVRYGTPPSAVAHLAGAADETVPVPFGRIREMVGERRDGGPAVRTVEVRLDRQLLRDGLSFVDTPGVGGLDSAHGNIALGALPLARAALFVTSAAQELTQPEIDFLRKTVDRCPVVLCVLTKIDLYEHWRRMVETNRGHLARAGLDMPIVAVSSFLRLRAAAAARPDDALNAESGFPRLLRALRRDVLAGADAATVRATDRDVAVALTQLREEVDAEREAVRHPEARDALAERLAEKARRSRDLAGRHASWQTALSDGIQDLASEVDHDLRERLRAMLRRGDALLQVGDPRDTWRDLEAWAAKEATAAAVDNLFTLVTRTDELAREVAGRFDLEYESLDLDLPAPSSALAAVEGPKVEFERSSMSRFLGAFTAARLAVGGLVIAGAVGALLDLTLLGPMGAAVGLVAGRKLVGMERERQVEHRRQQARQELRRYVDEVSFVVGKDSRDAVRRAQRYLRDEFSARAALVERSSARALEVVREAAAVPAAEVPQRVRDLEARSRDLAALAERLTTPATAPTGGPR